MVTKKNKNEIRQKRHLRLRAHLKGTAETPRLNVYRSTNNIYAQVIDDVKGVTLCAFSTKSKGVNVDEMTKTEAAQFVGTEIAKLAISKGIDTVVFDRGGYLYMGRVKALADAAREAGLKF
jgi:large subunit ribosomal protein L18